MLDAGAVELDHNVFDCSKTDFDRSREIRVCYGATATPIIAGRLSTFQ